MESTRLSTLAFCVCAMALLASAAGTPLVTGPGPRANLWGGAATASAPARRSLVDSAYSYNYYYYPVEPVVELSDECAYFAKFTVMALPMSETIDASLESYISAYLGFSSVDYSMSARSKVKSYRARPEIPSDACTEEELSKYTQITIKVKTWIEPVIDKLTELLATNKLAEAAKAAGACGALLDESSVETKVECKPL